MLIFCILLDLDIKKLTNLFFSAAKFQPTFAINLYNQTKNSHRFLYASESFSFKSIQ